MAGVKVVHVCTSDQGGAATSCIRLHEALLEQGVDSRLLVLSRKRSVPRTEVYTGQKKEPWYLKVFYRLKWLQRPYERRKSLLENKVAGFEHFSFTETDFDILQAPAIREADIIHLHWVAGFLDHSTFFKDCYKPVVWTMHDVNTFTGGCHYPSGCRLFTSECEICPQLAGTPDPSLSHTQWKKKKDSYRRAQLHLVAPSHWMQLLCKQSSLCGELPVSVIPYSLDLNIYKPQDRIMAREKLGLPPDSTILLFVSTSLDNRRKGLSILAEAVGMTTANVLLCGAGNNEGVSPIPKSVLLGNIETEEKMSLVYAACDAFVLPALEDNLPNVVIEALACGRPVIGFNIGGLPDMIRPGENGLLTDDISSRGLAVLIDQWMGSRGAFREQHIRQEAVRQFQPAIQAAAYSKIYEKVLNQSS